MAGARVPWIDLRRALGRQVAETGDRRALLRFHCSITGYRPDPHQIRWHLNQAPGELITHKLAKWGKGAGKTVLARHDTAMGIIANPGPEHLLIAKTATMAWDIQWYKGLRPIFEQYEKAGYPLVSDVRRSYPQHVELNCGSIIRLRGSNELGSIESYEFAISWAEEVEEWRRPAEGYAYVAERTRDSEAEFCQAIASTKPMGWDGLMGYWQAQREAARQIEDPALRRAHLLSWFSTDATMLDNPHLREGYHDQFRGMSRRRYAEVVEGKVLVPEGTVWPEYCAEHVVEYRYNPELPYDIACDWGDQWPHFLWIQRLPSGQAVVFDEYAEDRDNRDRQMQILRQRCTRLGREPENAAYDDSGGNGFWVGQLRKMFPKTRRRPGAHRGTYLGDSPRQRIEATRAMLDPVDHMGEPLEPQLLVARDLTLRPPERGIHHCLQRLKYQRSGDGQVKSLVHKDNVHDHGADALSYWCELVGLDHTQAATSVVGRRPGRQMSRRQAPRRERGWHRR